MKLKLTAPLEIAAISGAKLELLPVPMTVGFPSSKGAPWQSYWTMFLKPNGKRIPVDPDAVRNAQEYMRLHQTEALSEDGEIAFTIVGNELIECRPQG
jgi:hypothetical protein